MTQVLDVLDIPDEAELMPDERLTALQHQACDAVWDLTAGVGGAWCDGSAIRARVGPYTASSLSGLVRRGLLECMAPPASRRPHSRHSWRSNFIYRFTREGYAEAASVRGGRS